jgi:hypothetical protein
MTASWKRLINMTYAVSPELLLPHVPAGVTLDCIDGKAFVGLVPFSFENVTMNRLRIPFHQSFPEINLRFYVKHRLGRGVVFLRECAPKRAVVWLARKKYNEPYCCKKMKEKVRMFTDGTFSVAHSLWSNGIKNTVEVTARTTPVFPDKNSSAHYFKELELGFGIAHNKQTMLYRIHHPEWEVFPVVSYALNMNFGAVFGEKWAFLSAEKPLDVSLVKGSAVTVAPITPLL